MKIVDFENLFESKLRIYMKENEKKYTEEEWEERVPKLYKAFGDAYIKSVGATPKGYFAAMRDEELCAYLKESIEEKVPVSDFLLGEMEKRACPQSFSEAFKAGEDEEFLSFLLSAAGESARAMELCFEVLTGEYPEGVKCAALEKLKGARGDYSARAAALMEEGRGNEYLLELAAEGRGEKIFNILKNEIEGAKEEGEILRLCALAVRYGDERLKEALYRKIESEEVGYVAYRELKLALEALGGEYRGERDFSSDKDFLPIKAAAEKDRE